MIPEQIRRHLRTLRVLWQKTGLQSAMALVMGCAMAIPASAQSAYGCRALESHLVLPAVEGKDGTFFRLRPDLQTHLAIAGRTIPQLGALTKALAKRGTTLVLLPVPMRAQVMGHQLPSTAQFTGFDPDLIGGVQTELFVRLQEAGVIIADPALALRRAALQGEQVFFQTDPRPTAVGSRIMAQVVADVLARYDATKGLPRATFVTTEQDGTSVLASNMRSSLQLACKDALPQVETRNVTTAGQVAADVDASGVAAVIGTEMTGTAALNFAGYLSEASGLRAGSYGVQDGGAYAAISSYMTSVDFMVASPQVIVWEVPAWAPFGLRGDQPMAELIAAASGACVRKLTLRKGETPRTVSADLRGVNLEGAATLLLDSDGAAVAQAAFSFVSEDGLTRTRSIYRHPDQILTGRFYLPFSGLEQNNLTGIEVTLPAAFGAGASLSICMQGDTP